MAKQPLEKNERLKRRFLDYRKYARQLSDKTLDRELAALERFDVWNGRKDFQKFHIEWAMGFRSYLEQAKGATGRPLSKSTTRAIMATMREFTIWLSQQEGFRSRIRTPDADYFPPASRCAAPPRLCHSDVNRAIAAPSSWATPTTTITSSYLALEDIEHSRTKTNSPQTNGIVEPFHKTVLDEF